MDGINWKIIIKMSLSSISYIYYSATYTHTLVFYAFANIDDFSWGTKGASESKAEMRFS